MPTNPLVATEWLADHIGDPGLVIIDATWFMPGSPRDAKAEYAAGHIPGAVFFAIDEICDHTTTLPHMLAASADFAVAARRLGVNPDSRIVVYDAHGLLSAARVWWNFRVMGHDETYVLDGGLPKWIAELRTVEAGWPEPPHGEFKAHPVPALVRDLEAVRQALKTGDEQIIDARPTVRFNGEVPEPRAGLRGGHMPGALNLPSDSLTPGGVLASPAQLLTAFQAARVDLAEPIIATCGSGITASVLALALARLGRQDVAVYDGSWSEWGGRDDTAIVTAAASAV